MAAEGRAGYAVPGDHGSIFEDLTARAVKPDDALVVFFGSRNDQGVDPGLLAEKARDGLPSGTPLCAVREVPGDRTAVADRRRARTRYCRFVTSSTRRPGPSERRSSIRSAIGWFVDRPDLIGLDGVHPTDAGHQYLADKIAPLIRMQLSR